MTNTPEFKGHILELQQMHKVAENYLDDITLPTNLFAHPYEINPTELANDGTTPDDNHQYNGALTSHVIQPSLPNSPLTDDLVAMDDPPPRPCVEVSDATCLANTENLPEFLPQGS